MIKRYPLTTGLNTTPAQIINQLNITGLVMNEFVRYDADKGWQFAVKQENNKIITINCDEQNDIVVIIQ